jgi:2,3-bisphosphoglycerate-independent phosphoglycerate mutase
MPPSLSPRRPVVLCIFDGFGWREDAADNAVRLARTPTLDRLWVKGTGAFLEASETHVGLPDGQMGNSEVGHITLGAGRVVYQDLPLIDRAITLGELGPNPLLQDFIAKLKASGGTCHLMGLASPGGVHSHQRHIAALARLVAAAGVPVALHAFLDGRDTAPDSAPDQIATLQKDIADFPNVHLATLCGRYYAMDRDKRWDRVEQAYNLLVDGVGTTAPDAVAAIQASHAAGVMDEFVLPIVLPGYGGMKDGDGVLMANFRADRAREILTALLDPAFTGFARARLPHFAAALGMVPYSDALTPFLGTLFPPKDIQNGLGEVAAKAGLRQLRIAETEKYPHVTFFFSGGREDPYAGEDRILVPSPKVATYDLQPEMSAGEVTDHLVDVLGKGLYDLIIVNYANGDMVGHSGSLPAAIQAVEALDTALARLEQAVLAAGGVMLVTADHGNCEMMRDPDTNGPHTAHTLNRVPAFLVGEAPGTRLQDGSLADVAPTLLAFLGLPQPAEMTGKSLLTGRDAP